LTRVHAHAHGTMKFPKLFSKDDAVEEEESYVAPLPDTRTLDERVSYVPRRSTVDGRPRMASERMSMFSSGLSEAIMAMQLQRTELVEQGMSSNNFVLGVANTIITTYIVGAFPQHFWTYYAFQIFFLIIYRQTTWCKDKLHLYLLDYCWVTNYLLGIFSIFQLATFLAPFQLAPSEKRTEILQQIFFVWYTTASGPLSGAIAACGNSLVFHSFEHFANMYIHAAPMLAYWCLRWNAPSVEAVWPGLVPSNLESADAWSDLLLPTTIYYGAWWVPYTLWLVCDGVNAPAKGYDTVFNCFGPLLQAQLGIDNIRVVALFYMVLHGVVCFGAHAIAAYIFYSSFAAHTLFIVLVLYLAAAAGAKLYSGYMLDVMEAKVRERLEAKAEEKKAAREAARTSFAFPSKAELV